jgi:hypothetical protein
MLATTTDPAASDHVLDRTQAIARPLAEVHALVVRRTLERTVAVRRRRIAERLA